MMKDLKKIFFIIFIVVFVFFIVVGGVSFFLLQRFDPNKFKPQLIAQAEQALGRQVQLGHFQLKLSLTKGFSLSVEGVQIADDPQFSKEQFLTVERLGLGLDLLTLILKRQINVSSLEVLAPHVLLIRNEEGHFNFQTLKVLQAGTQSPQGQTAQTSSMPDQKSSAGLAALLIQNIVVRDGLFRFNDSFEEEKNLELKKIDLDIADFSLVKPFKVALKAAAFGDKQNIYFSGLGSVDVLGASLLLKNSQLRFDASSVDPRRLVDMVPDLAAAKLQAPLAGQCDLKIEEAKINAQGLTMTKLQGRVSGGEIKIGYLAKPVKDIQATMDILQDTLTVKNASCVLGGGRIDFKGTVANYLTSQDYSFAVKAENLNTAEMLNQARHEVMLEGLASAELNLQGKGLSDLVAFSPESGKGVLRLKDGQLININVLRLVLDKMSMLPDLVAKLEQNLPDTYKQKLQENNTKIKAVNFDVNILNGTFAIDPAQIETDVFALNGKGDMDLHLNAQMEMKIAIPQDLSKSMIDAVPELKFLKNNQGQIMIPLMIQGKIPDKLMYLPDLEYLGRQLFESQGRQELNNLLDKVFKVKGQAPSSDPEAPPTPSQNNAEAAKEVINSVLDSIFKK